MSNPPKLVAAADLGSNSFHLLIGRVVESPLGFQIYALDSLKEVVRLAAGLGPDKRLDAASQARAILALQRFGERLRSFSPDRVRAVATNTLRVAKNGQDFLKTAEAALGFPIEVIAGQEEARLIYSGVAHSLPSDGRRRLVIDIGGGSTEFIIGRDHEPELLESVYVGCVRFSREYFPGGLITRSAMKAAVLAARKDIQVIRKSFVATGWEEVLGSSGTAKSIAEVLLNNGLSEEGINTIGLEKLRSLLSRVGRIEDAGLIGMRQDRMPVFAGGVAIMSAIFDELGIETMRYGEGALRLGVLYDLVGRAQHEDMRRISVEQAMRRYSVDIAQSSRISLLALKLWNGLRIGSDEERAQLQEQLTWAACLHEIGHSISHNSFHKHSAYIVTHADLPGFSRREQRVVAAFVLGQQGKLAKIQSQLDSPAQWAALMCFRLACLFYRRRLDIELPEISLKERDPGFRLRIGASWLDQHPLTGFSLQQESAEWGRLGIDLQLHAVQEEGANAPLSAAGA
ncbi:MAG: Ppx/GppA family phosphatase [Burkholderiaceae bacterium]|nr:Ppx/GppA family phosphatase [Burkholderiaceae bacterium]